jgi:hypothetical protein
LYFDLYVGWRVTAQGFKNVNQQADVQCLTVGKAVARQAWHDSGACLKDRVLVAIHNIDFSWLSAAAKKAWEVQQ